MSFLFPLYIAGLAALTLPIAFHLIRRAPRGRQAFSSLMFLTPSPPRVTRRSRLDHILLLLLRAGVLTLLALAFARPFWRQADETTVHSPGRRIVLLVDTSASMRRTDLWQQAQDRVAEVLSAAEPGDEFALMTFDRAAARRTSFDEWTSAMRADRRELIETRLAGLQPSWRATDLAQALAAAAEVLHETETGKTDSPSSVTGQIILISDLAVGESLSGLASFTWPEDVLLRKEPLSPPSPTNAGLHVLADAADAEDAQTDTLRFRVINAADSTCESFQLAWASPQGASSEGSASVHVPPGEARVVKLKRPAALLDVDRIVLSGDDHDFDNTFFIAPHRRETIHVAFYGGDNPDDPQGLLYYLRAALDSPDCEVGPPLVQTAVAADTDNDAQPVPDEPPARLIVAAGELAEDELDIVRRHLQSGGVGLYVLCPVADGEILSRLVGAKVSVREAEVQNYAMLGEVDFAHPLLAPLADARFADFTKVHFWKYRQVTWPADSMKDMRALLKFENGDPALVETPVHGGRLFVLTGGWQPADSQLALSSKFVPLLKGLLALASGKPPLTQYLTGDAASPDPDAAPGVYSILSANGDESSPSDGESAATYAINLPAGESETSPVTAEELEHHGVRLGTAPSAAEQHEVRRQMRERELEQRQQWWRWLVLAGLGLVLAETVVAKRLTMRGESRNDE